MDKPPSIQKVTSLFDMYDLIVQVSSPLVGELKDWPANIQDGVLAALMRKGVQEGTQLTIVKAEYRYDLEYGHYIHVVARSPSKLVNGAMM